MYLIYLSCAWLAGIYLGSNLTLPRYLIATGIIPLILLIFRRHHKPVILASLCLFTLFAAAAYADTSLHTFSDKDLRFYHDMDNIELKGVVSREPELSDRSARLYLSAAEIKLDGNWKSAQGTVLLMAPRYPAYEYGDVLLVTGRLETPPQLDDFDYRSYLAHQGIYTVISYPRIYLLERDKGFQPLDWIYTLRRGMAQTFLRVIPEPQASLAQGIILGIRDNIPPAVEEDFARSGTAHLLAISGLHLGIVAAIILSLGIWLFGRRHYHYLWLTLGTVWCYALLTGMHPPVVRAAFMVSLFLIADAVGRQRSAGTALFLAAAVMTSIDPYILGNASFQLSFLAMAGLIFLFPLLRNAARTIVNATLAEGSTFYSPANLTADSFSVTLAAIIAVWPVVAYYFGFVSLAAPLATFLALPALPAIFITGTVTGLLGFVSIALAQVTGWLSWLFLSYLTTLAHALATPGAASIALESVNTNFILLYYTALVGLTWFAWQNTCLTRPLSRAVSLLTSKLTTSRGMFSHIPKKFALPALLATALLTVSAAATMPDDRLHVSFLDVSEGDAILLQRGSQQILIDGGPSPQAINLALSKKMPFWDRTIDLLILTHPHQDHLAGLVEVLQRYQVSQVFYPDLNDDAPLYQRWQDLITEKGIKATLAYAGQEIRLGEEITIAVISPPPSLLTHTASDIDNNSLVLRLSAGAVSFLFTADIMSEAEDELLRERAEISSTVLKVPHHGAATASTTEFLATVQPQLAVISVGSDNRFQHPSTAVVGRLADLLGSDNVLRSDRQGTIEFITDGERLWLRTER